MKVLLRNLLSHSWICQVVRVRNAGQISTFYWHKCLNHWIVSLEIVFGCSRVVFCCWMLKRTTFLNNILFWIRSNVALFNEYVILCSKYYLNLLFVPLVYVYMCIVCMICVCSLLPHHIDFVTLNIDWCWIWCLTERCCCWCTAQCSMTCSYI